MLVKRRALTPEPRAFAPTELPAWKVLIFFLPPCKGYFFFHVQLKSHLLFKDPQAHIQYQGLQNMYIAHWLANPFLVSLNTYVRA